MVILYRELKVEEKQEFRDCIYEDDKMMDFFRYFSLCHPITKNEVMKHLKKLM